METKRRNRPSSSVGVEESAASSEHPPTGVAADSRTPVRVPRRPRARQRKEPSDDADISAMTRDEVLRQFAAQRERARLEAEIAKMRQELLERDVKLQAMGEHEKDIVSVRAQLESDKKKFAEKEAFSYLLEHVGAPAQDRLMKDPAFAKGFELGDDLTFVLSI